MNIDEKLIKIQDNLATLPSLSRGEFEIIRAETDYLINEVENYLDIDHLEISILE